MAEYRSAGWYRDPKGGAGERWWNGISWSDTVRNAGGALEHAPANLNAARSRAARSLPPVLNVHQAVPPVIYSPSNPAPQAPGTSLARRIPGGYTIDARANRMAFASVASGIIGLFASVLIVPSLLSIVFALMGLAHARRMAADGDSAATSRTMSWVGLALGTAGLALGIGQIVLFVTTLLGSVPPGLLR